MPDLGQGVSIEVFETDEQAKAAAPPNGADAAGVTWHRIPFAEVTSAR
jgi:hypothetical protein